ncbi:MAG: hypothetical protein ACM3KR_04765 [Deltaproteobacteria bacterium]
MDILDSFLGMPWNDLIELLKAAIVMLYSKYLFMTIVVYIFFIIAVVVTDVTDMLIPYLFYFTVVFMLLARPIVGIFSYVDWFLKSCGITLPSFFA